jgi:hypothetical protein
VRPSKPVAKRRRRSQRHSCDTGWVRLPAPIYPGKPGCQNISAADRVLSPPFIWTRGQLTPLATLVQWVSSRYALTIMVHVLTLATSSSGTVTVVLGAISVAAALVALSVAAQQTRQLKQQIEKLANTENALQETQSRIDGLSTEVYDVLELYKAASSSAALLSTMRKLAINCGQVFSQENIFLKKFLESQLDLLVKSSGEATTQHLEVQASNEVAGMALNLVKLAQPNEEVITTSYVSTDKYWDDPSGQRYLEVNEELIKNRNVSITRIFLFDSQESEEKSRPEMAKQHAAGIKVRTALTRNLTIDLKRDMFLLGSRLAAENVMTNDQNDILSVRIWDSSQKEVGEFAERMDILMHASVGYDPDRDSVAVTP